MNFIQGEKFQNMADFRVISPEIQGNFIELVSNFQGIPVIYAHTHYADNVNQILQKCRKLSILVTHNSDHPVDEARFGRRAPCIMKWFAQNVDFRHPDLISLPIGLENSQWFPHLHKLATMEHQMKQPRQYMNMIYVNCNVATNPGRRRPVYDFFSGKSYATVENGYNGVGWNNFIGKLYNHLFVACPEGNGIDTVRLWETLYMGNIPVVTAGPNVKQYWDLPICIIDDWKQATEEFLGRKHLEIRNHKYNMDKLDFSWWRQRIENERKHLQTDNS